MHHCLYIPFWNFSTLPFATFHFRTLVLPSDYHVVNIEKQQRSNRSSFWFCSGPEHSRFSLFLEHFVFLQIHANACNWWDKPGDVCHAHTQIWLQSASRKCSSCRSYYTTPLGYPYTRLQHTADLLVQRRSNTACWCLMWYQCSWPTADNVTHIYAVGSVTVSFEINGSRSGHSSQSNHYNIGLYASCHLPCQLSADRWCFMALTVISQHN